ncbi:MAG TPA: glycosyltransferase 87 family protein [Gaiellaceae bacterium]
MVAALAVVFLGCWEALHHWFYAHNVITDTPAYQGYGLAMRNGIAPYRDIPVEYPPGALPVFLAPTYVGGYDATFGWLMAVCGLGCLLFAAAARARLHALAFIAVSPLLIGALALTRFDFWPMLFVVAALAAFVRDRHSTGWFALGAGVAAKLFPLVLVPLAAVWTLRRRGAHALALSALWGIAAIAVAFVPFLVIAPHGIWNSLDGEATRPLQIESLAASALMTFGRPTVFSSHGSINLAGQGTLATVTTVAELVVLVSLWFAFARGPSSSDRFLRYAAACLCAFIALGKVLSPQFLIWLVPTVALVRGRRGYLATAILTAAWVATDVFFPKRYFEYVFHFQLAWVVFVRDLLLLGLLVTLSWPERAPARSS